MAEICLLPKHKVDYPALRCIMSELLRVPRVLCDGNMIHRCNINIYNRFSVPSRCEYHSNGWA